MKHLSLKLFLLIILVSSNSTSAQEYFFRQYSIQQGLPQSSVFCAIEDQRGEMWIGTDGSGICRFNGVNFKVINKSNGLSGNIVRTVFEDSRGDIWIGTDNGMNRYDGRNLHSYTNTEINETAVMAIAEDKSGNIWVGTYGKGLFRISFGDSLIIDNYTADDGLASLYIFDIDFDKNQRLWLSMVGGVNIFDINASEIQVKKLIEGYDIPDGVILCGNIDNEGDMWFGSMSHGVFKVEVTENIDDVNVVLPDYLQMLEEERIWDIYWTAQNEGFIATEDMGVYQIKDSKVVNQFTKESGIRTNQIYRITESKNGDIWFSTLGNGILKFENKLLVKYHDGSGIRGTQIYDVYVDSKKELLVGTDEGFAIYKFKKDKPIEVANYNMASGLPSNDITSICTAKDEIWLGSSSGITQIRNGKVHNPKYINDGLTSSMVNCLLKDSQGNLWIGTDAGYNLYRNGELFRIDEDQGFINNEVQTIIEDKSGDVWLGTLGGLVRMHGQIYTDFVNEDGLLELGIHALAEDKNGDIWIGTFGGGIFLFSQDYDSIPIRQIAGNDVLSSNNIYSLAFLSDSVIIAATENGFDQITIGPDNEVLHSIHYDVNDGFAGGGNSLNAVYVDKSSLVWFGNSEGLVRFDPSEQTSLLNPPNIQINNIKLFFTEQDWKLRGEALPWFNLPKNLVLPHTENNLTIGYSCVYYGNHNDLTYSYHLDGQRGDWSPFEAKREADFPGLAPGKYTFQVRAKNKYGIISEPASFSFITIKPPFWLQPWFIALVVIILIVAVIVIIRMRTRKLQLEKIQLEKIVLERTKEVVEQKNHIEQQHFEIESSIHYAEKIQQAVIPSEEILRQNFSDSFILFRPQHIVSGDFYWIGQKGDYVIFAAVDCTGHGVPGAFMSMLGISYLNQIVLTENTVEPNKILNKLRTHIINSFKQKESAEDDRKDGMDITLCAFNKTTKKLYFSAAYNPLFLVRHTGDESEIIEMNADKMPVGLYAKMDGFTLNEVNYIPGDTIYLFSDGFPDQFGGDKFKKFMKKRFKEMIIENQGKPFKEQREIYNSVLEEWMSYKDPDGDKIIQTDDILLIGVKL